jgi:hypothetical protein
MRYYLYFLGGNYVVQFLDKFSTAPALMLVVMMEAIAASWVSLINNFVFKSDYFG